ncbi:M48 family metalloprotease [Streptosporangium sp. NPDC051022]|uniref:M48 family metalloprotease n=1 Tax=Streptosporangium sp. NPDC051022 TaxID=3155752 RepID=UPI00344AC10F
MTGDDRETGTGTTPHGDAPTPPGDASIPSGTTLRFILLVLLLLAGTAWMAGDTLLPITGGGRGYEPVCMLAAGVDPEGSSLSNIGAMNLNEEALKACADRFGRKTEWPLVVMAAAVVVSAAVLYFLLPVWKSRRGRAVPIDEVAGDEELSRLLRELAGRAGVRNVRFSMDPAAATASAVAFGRPGHYTVRLHGGLVARRHSDPDGFEAVVLHELAHVRSGDVRLAYATTALWRVFFVAVLLPYAVFKIQRLFTGAVFHPDTMFFAGSVPVLSRELVLSLVLTALITLARADLLRNREFHADLAAVRWGASPSVWARPVENDRARGSRRAIGDLWRTHPRWARRLSSLDDPSSLFGSPVLVMLLTGIAALLTLTMLPTLLIVLGLPGAAAEPVSVLCVAGFVAGIVTTALAPPTAHAVATGRPVPSGLYAGLALGAGLLAAALLPERIDGHMWLPTKPAGLLVLPVVAAVVCWWTAECAELWIRTRRGRPLRPVLLAGTAATWIVLALWLTWWESNGQLLISDAQPSLDVSVDLLQSIVGTAAPGRAPLLAINILMLHTVGVDDFPLWLVAGGLLWLYPLLALAWRPEPAEERPSLRRLTGAAIVGAALCWVAELAAMAYIHSWRPSASPPQTGTATVLWILMLAAVTVGSAAAAALVASTARRHRMSMALIAAGIASLLSLGGVWLIGSFDGCLGPLNALSYVCVWKPGPSAMFVGSVAVPYLLGLITPVAALTVLLVGPWGNRPHAAGRWTARSGGGRGSRFAVAAIVSAAVAVTVLPFRTLPESSPTQSASSLQKFKDATVRSIRPPSSPVVRSLQLAAWLIRGGGELTLQIFKDFSALGRLLAEKGTVPDDRFWKEIPDRATPHLRSILGGVERAGHYFTVPGAREHRLWTELLANVKRDATACADALEQGDPKALGEAFHRFTATMDRLETFFRRMMTTASEATKGVPH